MSGDSDTLELPQAYPLPDDSVATPLAPVSPEGRGRRLDFLLRWSTTGASPHPLLALLYAYRELDPPSEDSHA